MVAFVFSCIFWLAALVGIAVAVWAPAKIRIGYSTTYPKFIGGVAAVVAAILGFGIFYLSGVNEVPMRNLGVVSSFGKVEGSPLSPGFHWELPWKSVTNISETKVTDNYNQNTATPHWTGTCITIRLGEGQEGCADVSVTYNVSPQGADSLLVDYGADNIQEQVQNNLVYNNVRSSLNDTFGDYSPISDALQTGTSGTSQFTQYNGAVKAALIKAIGSQVDVTNFDVQYIHYSTEVQSQLDGIQTKQGQLQQEKEQLLINQATSSANEALVSSKPLTGEQLQQECMTVLQIAEKDNYSLPATFGNCLSGSGASSVIVNGK